MIVMKTEEPFTSMLRLDGGVMCHGNQLVWGGNRHLEGFCTLTMVNVIECSQKKLIKQ